MRKKYLPCLCLLTVTTLLTSCGSNAVKSVEDGTLDLDPSVTIGDALNRYPFFDHTAWEQIEDPQKRTVVEFRGQLNLEKLVNADWPFMHKLPTDFIQPFVSQQRQTHLKVTCIEQFTLAKDGKSVELTYSGLQESKLDPKSGQPTTYDEPDPDLSYFKDIYSGKPAHYVFNLIDAARQPQ